VKMRGKVHRYGSDVNTDVIIPARYLNESDPDELARHCMEDIDRDFVSRVQAGDIIVADTNFGCGSSREHAPLAIKAAGVGCIVAKSFGRIFFRNALNIGLPILECVEAVDNTGQGDVLDVELSTGEIVNVTRGLTFKAKPFPDFMLQLMEAGGLIEYTRRRVQSGRSL
jgi:3-isopropylmalate/(R)-2-methylmalate dehydratase small subunit